MGADIPLDDNRAMFDRLLRMLDDHPELVGDVRFETTPTGIIAMSPADLAHGAIIRELRRQLDAGLGGNDTRGLDVNQDAGFVVAGLKKIPDLFVLDYDRHAPESDGYVQGVDGVWLFAEVTSPSTRAADLGLTHTAENPGKPWVYAEAGVPLYLVVDRKQARVLLYAEPGPGGYTPPTICPVGERLWLPHPFGFAVDTEAFKPHL
ncbi:Uma2 family endonuclease [Yinghuangia sp. YIM S10712]|uniref:Uma2 family endonuclease n=1 Tax=Yinghuangia sp. YIM S10712 TaxID=3436930 RepID=UPI003F53DC92